MLSGKGFWRFMKMVTGAGFLFSVEMLVLLYVLF